MESNNHNSKIAIAVMAGIAAGAATWYLMSTENGKHQWRTFLDIAKDISDKLIDLGEEQGSTLASAGRSISDYVENKSGEYTSQHR